MRGTARSYARTVIVAAALIPLLAGCAVPWSAAHRTTRTTLLWPSNVGSSEWVTTLDPATVADPVAISDVQLIYAGLVKFSYQRMAAVPDLATWTVSADRTIYTFHIRKGARFSNGDRVTAGDAAWSLTRALLPATKSPVATTYLGHIVGALDVAKGKAATLAGARVVNPGTLQIALDAPINYFLPALTYPTGAVLDRRLLEGKAADTYLTSTCRGNVGAGPFRLHCRNAGATPGSFYPPSSTPRLDFEPNPYYYGSRPRIHIRAPFLESSEAAWASFGKGQLDAVTVPPSHVTAAKRMKGFRQAPLLQTDFLTPNMSGPPFSDVNCRLAIAYALDRRSITGRVLRGVERPLYGIVPAPLPGHIGLQPGMPFFDRNRAREYLARCPGRLDGIALTFDRSTPDLQRESRAIRDDLHAIGANVVLRPLPFHSWLTVVVHPLAAARPPVVLAQNLWVAEYPDPQDWCDTLLRTGASFDVSGYRDPDYDRLVDTAEGERNPVRRADLYVRAQKLALATGAWIGIGQALGSYLIGSDVRGITATANGLEPKGGDWSRVTISG